MKCRVQGGATAEGRCTGERSVQDVVENGVDNPGSDGDQNQVAADLTPLVAGVVWQVTNLIMTHTLAVTLGHRPTLHDDDVVTVDRSAADVVTLGVHMLADHMDWRWCMIDMPLCPIVMIRAPMLLDCLMPTLLAVAFMAVLPLVALLAVMAILGGVMRGLLYLELRSAVLRRCWLERRCLGRSTE